MLHFLADVETVEVANSDVPTPAEMGSDYNPINEKITFLPREHSHQVTIALKNDENVESEETFSVQLISSNNDVDDERKRTAVIVKDDDGKIRLMVISQTT